MASIFRRAMVYLGLAPEAAYESVPDEHYQPINTSPGTGYSHSLESELEPVAAPPGYEADGIYDVGAYEPQPSDPGLGHSQSSTVSVVPRNSAAGGTTANAVRGSSPQVIAPNSFTDAQFVGDRFKNQHAVILNLQGLERALARRLLDFASGLCYGLGGEMSKVAHQVYLLVPADVELTEEDRNQIRQPGSYRPN